MPGMAEFQQKVHRFALELMGNKGYASGCAFFC